MNENIMNQIGKFQKIELRTLWNNEAQDFTPWLAREENLALLAEALEFDELSLESTEKSVGPYSIDILAKDYR